MARSFNGTTDKLVSASTVTIASTQCTVSFFAQAAQLKNLLKQFFAFGVNTILSLEGNANAYTTVSHTGGSYGIVQPTPGYWHHYALVLDRNQGTTGARTKFYVDGVLRNDTQLSAGTQSAANYGTQTVYVMVNSGNTLFTQGRFCRLSIHTRALSQAEVSSLASGTLPTAIANCQNYWPITGGSSPEPDSLGGPSLTVTGTAQVADPTFPLPVDLLIPNGDRFYYDEFTGAAGSVEGHTPNVGPGWVLDWSVNSVDNFLTGSGEITANISTPGGYGISLTQGSFPQTFILQYRQKSAAAASGQKVVWNTNPAGGGERTGYEIGYISGANPLYRLQRNNKMHAGGSAVILADIPEQCFWRAGTFQDGTTRTLKIVTEGTGRIRLYIDGSLIANVTDASPLSGGSFGVSNTTAGVPGVNGLVQSLEGFLVGGILPEVMQTTFPFHMFMGPKPEEEKDEMICRRALDSIFAEYTVQSGELVWAFQIRKDYCVDWVFLSPGLLVDPAATTKTLNTGFGIRLYEIVQTGHGTWLTDSSSATNKIGKGVPIWDQPAWYGGFIPWSKRSGNILVEFYTNGAVTPAANSKLEFIAKLYEEVPS